MSKKIRPSPGEIGHSTERKSAYLRVKKLFHFLKITWSMGLKSRFLPAAFMLGSVLMAQQTLILQPNAECGKDAIIGHCVPCGYADANFGESDELNIMSWTNGGTPSNVRALMQFDLSLIPAGSVVNSAILTLYYNPTASQGPTQHSSNSGPNDGYIQRLMAPWDEMTVTWNNQPIASTTDQVYIPESTSGTQDYPVDITGFAQAWVDDPAVNHGIVFRLVTEEVFRCILLASSDHSDAQLHPRLELTFTPEGTGCIGLQYGSCPGTDAIIGDCISCGYDDDNFGHVEELNAISWTNSGSESNVRSLMSWDLSSIPSNATVVSAELSLFYNPTAGQGFPEHSGENAATLYRITSTWDESTVTWNTQPTITADDSVPLPSSTSGTQDYTGIDVSGIVQFMVANPSGNFGIMLRLDSENVFRGLLFASSDHPDPALRPRLDVCYTLTTGTTTPERVRSLSVFPNPVSDQLTIVLDEDVEHAQVEIHDFSGRLVFKGTANSRQTECDVRLVPGHYTVSVTGDRRSWAGGFLAQ